MKTMIENAILKNVEKLPESVKQAVFDYTEFLVNRYAADAPNTAKAPKRGGLGYAGCSIFANFL